MNIVGPLKGKELCDCSPWGCSHGCFLGGPFAQGQSEFTESRVLPFDFMLPANKCGDRWQCYQVPIRRTALVEMRSPFCG